MNFRTVFRLWVSLRGRMVRGGLVAGWQLVGVLCSSTGSSSAQNRKEYLCVRSRPSRLLATRTSDSFQLLICSVGFLVDATRFCQSWHVSVFFQAWNYYTVRLWSYLYLNELESVTKGGFFVGKSCVWP